MTDELLPDWHRAYGVPSLSCEIRKENTDFRVHEDLGYELSGDGEHDYLKIEKDGANTTWVARSLAKFAKCSVSDIGFSGLKDRHAITTQWFSVHRPAGGKVEWSELALNGVRVIRVARHRRKLRRGAHSGNQFRIALKSCSECGDDLAERLNKIANCGVPNYFGEQRFGRDGGNLDLAIDYFGGKRLSRNKRSMAISAPRSLLFNHILDDRVRNGTWNALLPGDCASLDGSASNFRVDAIDAELRRRIDDLDIHPSGALWGGAVRSGGDISRREQEIASRFPELKNGLENERLRPARRALRLAVRRFNWEPAGNIIWLDFYLARGGYATAVLREIATY